MLQCLGRIPAAFYFAGLGRIRPLNAEEEEEGSPSSFLRSRVASLEEEEEEGEMTFAFFPFSFYDSHQPTWDGTAGRTRCIPCFVGVCVGFLRGVFLFGSSFFCFFATEESSKNLSVAFTVGGGFLSQTLRDFPPFLHPSAPVERNFRPVFLFRENTRRALFFLVCLHTIVGRNAKLEPRSLPAAVFSLTFLKMPVSMAVMGEGGGGGFRGVQICHNNCGALKKTGRG